MVWGWWHWRRGSLLDCCLRYRGARMHCTPPTQQHRHYQTRAGAIALPCLGWMDGDGVHVPEVCAPLPLCPLLCRGRGGLSCRRGGGAATGRGRQATDNTTPPHITSATPWRRGGMSLSAPQYNTSGVHVTIDCLCTDSCEVGRTLDWPSSRRHRPEPCDPAVLPPPLHPPPHTQASAPCS